MFPKAKKQMIKSIDVPDQPLGYTELNRHNIVSVIGEPEYPHAESKFRHSCSRPDSASPSPAKSK
jgi:hypothetical protein